MIHSVRVCVCVSSEEMKTHKTASREQDLFPGITFASDMNVSQCLVVKNSYWFVSVALGCHNPNQKRETTWNYL